MAGQKQGGRGGGLPPQSTFLKGRVEPPFSPEHFLNLGRVGVPPPPPALPRGLGPPDRGLSLQGLKGLIRPL